MNPEIEVEMLDEPASDQKQTSKQPVQTIVHRHVLYSMGFGLIPVPLIDIAAVTAMQVKMIRQLSDAYSIDFSEGQTKSILTALTGSTLAHLGAGAIKMIPGIGSIIGGVSMSILSGASTYAVGKVFIRHFEAGGTIEDLNVDDFTDYYKEQLSRGKEYASRAKERQEYSEATTDEQERSISKLKDIAKLRDKGILSEKEYLEMKQKILSEF